MSWRYVPESAESETGNSTTPPYGTTFAPLTGCPGVDRWILRLAVSPASPSRLPENGAGHKTNGIFGRASSVSFARFDPAASSWRTSQGCLAWSGEERLEAFSQTWPRGFLIAVEAGLKASAYALRTSEHRISGNASSSWPTPTAIMSGYNQSASPHAVIRPSLEMMARKNRWPTPKAQNANAPGLHGDGAPDLQTAVHLWPTPCHQDGKNANLPPSQEARDTLPGAGLRQGMWSTPQAHDADKWSYRQQGYTRNLTHQVQSRGYYLNPEWVECLMGFPIGWTATNGLPGQGNHNMTGSQDAPSPGDF